MSLCQFPFRGLNCVDSTCCSAVACRQTPTVPRHATVQSRHDCYQHAYSPFPADACHPLLETRCAMRLYFSSVGIFISSILSLLQLSNMAQKGAPHMPLHMSHSHEPIPQLPLFQAVAYQLASPYNGQSPFLIGVTERTFSPSQIITDNRFSPRSRSDAGKDGLKCLFLLTFLWP